MQQPRSPPKVGKLQLQCLNDAQQEISQRKTVSSKNVHQAARKCPSPGTRHRRIVAAYRVSVYFSSRGVVWALPGGASRAGTRLSLQRLKDMD